jgi:hypothetical protein
MQWLEKMEQTAALVLSVSIGVVSGLFLSGCAAAGRRHETDLAPAETPKQGGPEAGGAQRAAATDGGSPPRHPPRARWHARFDGGNAPPSAPPSKRPVRKKTHPRDTIQRRQPLPRNYVE